MKEKLIAKMMRTAAMVLLSVLVVSCGMLSHNANDIIDDMRDARNAQYVNVGSGLLGLGRLVLPSISQAGLGISSVRVLDLSKCQTNVREKFRKRIQELYKNRSYEEVIANQNGLDTRTALVRKNGQYVTEIVLANADATSDAIVVVEGRINFENLERIINEQVKTLSDGL